MIRQRYIAREAILPHFPLKLSFHEKGLAKLDLALTKGKKNHDKRETGKNPPCGFRYRLDDCLHPLCHL
ncbi:SsrA-binding protein [Candidatus Liberibacter sp.]|uniref:SsrA-binding protein n=1 Tax=Candidatus Liberibacter sp. TaxID=34022 RepID=UPI0015F5C4B1|nr:SsrA-binding protein [Candidatus Liberibacter sp.]